MKAYPVYKECSDEWVKSIPSAWDLKWLKHHFNFEKGKEAQKYTKEYVAEKLGEYPVYSGQTEDGGILGSIDTYEYDSVPVIFVTTVGAKAMSSQLISGKYSLSQNCAIITPKGETKDVRFFHYLLQYIFPLEKSKISLIMQPSLRFSDLAQYRILYPPLPEQQAIADFLDRKTAQIDTLIEKKQRQIDLLQEQRTALINQVVTKGLNPNVSMKDSGVEWLGEIPSHWEISQSKWLFSVREERARPDDIQLSATQAYGVISQEEFMRRVGRRVTQITKHLEKRKHVEIDDFVISMRSFQGGLERAWERGCIRSSYVVLQPSSKIVVNYFTHLFKSFSYIQALRATSNYLRDGQDMNFHNFSLVALPIIPKSEQKEIAAFLDKKIGNIDLLIEKSNQLIVLLEEFRAGLISEAVTGKIDIRTAETVHE